MSYTASVLSFMLKNLGKTVILTGAQRPIQEIRSDGLQNLLTSIEIIERQTQVWIFFPKLSSVGAGRLKNKNIRKQAIIKARGKILCRLQN